MSSFIIQPPSSGASSVEHRAELMDGHSQGRNEPMKQLLWSRVNVGIPTIVVDTHLFHVLWINLFLFLYVNIYYTTWTKYVLEISQNKLEASSL